MGMLDDDINNKTNYIMKILSKLNFNKNLKLEEPSSYLKFQIDFLYNEKNYFSNTKKYFIKKFVDDLYNISDHIILILISLNDLDIGYHYEKDNIMNKIIKIPKQTEVNSSKITELVSCLNTN